MDLPLIVKDKLISLGADPEDTFLVALSGGADSTALLLAMHASLESSGTLMAAHLDHAVRPGSGRDAEKVVELCSDLAVRVVTGHLAPDILDARRRAHGSLEAAMRELRYRFLFEAARNTGSKWIVTGHTADDQAETVLFRVCRGMHWRSLGAIPEIRGKVLRPLIDVPRSATERYCRDRGVKPLSDPTNYDDSHERNRIRNRVLPALAAGFDPDISSHLRRTGLAARRLTRAQDKLLDQYARRSGIEGVKTLTRDSVLAFPGGLRERVIADHLLHILGQYPSGRLVADVTGFILAGRNGQLSLPGNVILTLSYGRLDACIDAGTGKDGIPPAALKLDVPGRIAIPSAGIIITAEEAVLETPGNYPGGNRALLAGKSASGTLWVRKRLPGDRFIPLGMKNHRKLKDFLVDRKVPRAGRDLVPVVMNDRGDILWIGGVEISQLAALEGVRGEEAILVRMEKMDDR